MGCLETGFVTVLATLGSAALMEGTVPCAGKDVRLK